jgi:putative ABC transport system permease protein
VEADLNAEIEAHLALATEEYLQQGMSAEEAWLAARRSFGPTEAVKDTLRDGRGVLVVDSLLRDIRLAVRLLRRSRSYAALASFTLALGIAAVTTVSAFLHEILIRPLPFWNPQELVMIWTSIPGQNIEQDGSAYLTVEDWKQRNRSFAGMALVSRVENDILFGTDEPEQIKSARVSANLFSLLGVSPLIGRTFSQWEEDRREPVAVLSYAFWKSRFDGSPQALGQRIRTADGLLQVIGVMPPEFRFPSKEIQFWEPHTLPSYWPDVKYYRGSDVYKVVARLRPGVTWQYAEPSMNVLAQQIAAEHAEMPRGLGVRVIPLHEQLTGRTMPVALRLLFAAVAGLLLIACANVAGLMLARGLSREREFAIRMAIGAGRMRLIQQLLIESLVLALFAGLLGVASGSAAIRLVQASLPLDLPHVGPIGMSGTVAVFSAGLSLATLVLCGIIPALQLSTTSPAGAFRGAPAASRFARSAMRQTLVVAELAVATALVAGTGLLVRSFLNVQQTDPGFETGRVLAARVTLPDSYSRARGAEYYREAMERLRALPGVVAAGAIHELFFEYNPDTVIAIEGRPPARADQPVPQLIGDAVTGDYFQAMGVPLLRGRLLSSRDTAEAPGVSLINETMARTFFPNEDPIGKRFTFGTPGPKSSWITIVGIVGDMHRQGLEAPSIPQMFGPRDQFPNNRMDVVIRTDRDPNHLKSALRITLRELDKSALVSPPTIVRDQLSQFDSWRRFQTWLLTTFAAVALTLAAMGIYGLLQQILAQRRKEIGIRMALGARAGQVQRMVLRQALTLVGAGLMIGIGVALAGTRALRALLFGVTEHDPVTIACTTILLLTSAAAAAWFPSKRASRMDPVATLRED